MTQFDSEIQLALSKFDCISLQEMDAVKLMSRVDSKFMFHVRHLPELLEAWALDYEILEINGNRSFLYDSVYLDTPGFRFYINHHRGKPNRIKLRFRKYLETGAIYFELKKKVKGSRTNKFRVKVDRISEDLPQAAQALLLRHNLAFKKLELKHRIVYHRITLVHRVLNERATIDFGLSFGEAENAFDYPELVIAELKQEKRSRISPFVLALRDKLISEMRISKYTLAVALLSSELKTNAFKMKLLKLEKIIS